jgi:hypothetical protein
MQVVKKARMLAVRISDPELAELKAALPKLRRATGEDWDLSRMVREGTRMLAETAEAGLRDQPEQRIRHAHKGGAR